ncbi:hypothetical protein F1737_09665 [Methanoplanus sp. FWC-SCC4]|uniref:Uncharacterized protein n=1 Tax=Methanochimaera problematica TaxID=2609417 RepID=A0AA97I3Q0_9EURY|nr:hypothetical protein [Methanoplanus sp. FWC-SCC4]WOF16933.1 hypothetical protein F1737_09665 [Methanoplanus sp. FWC-SCC4]
MRQELPESFISGTSKKGEKMIQDIIEDPCITRTEINMGSKICLFSKNINMGLTGLKEECVPLSLIQSDLGAVLDTDMDILYPEIRITPADELPEMSRLLKEAESDGMNTDLLKKYLDEALRGASSGDMDGYNKSSESFYRVYDGLYTGYGGHLFPTGDYLSFSPDNFAEYSDEDCLVLSCHI